MNQEKKNALNPGQIAAAEGFLKFLMGDKKELIISGAGGYGKTFLMGYLIDETIPQYEALCALAGIKPEYHSVHMTATTNKAAEVLGLATGRPAQTIHSLINVMPKEDFNTGKTRLLRTKKWYMHQNEIIFIDECSMIDTELRREILNSTLNCKIVYVGDHSQLPPVFEELSPIYKDDLPFFELTQPMRTNVPELQALCQQFRETVANGEFLPIQCVPGVIEWIDPDDMAAVVKDVFVDDVKDARILAYSNTQVNDLNDFVRHTRSLPPDLQPGDRVINNTAVMLPSGQLSAEEEVEIIRVSAGITEVRLPGATMDVRMMDLKAPYGDHLNVPVPTDKAHLALLIKHYARQKDWVTYFMLKQGYPDLRPRDACTVHKSQGSSLDYSIIDLEDLSTCKNAKVAARLFYVAVSRARKGIIMYGQLAERFGKIIK